MRKEVSLQSHDPIWAETYSAEARRILSVMGDNVRATHHIGSTAIPAMVAKPIIDMLIVVGDISRVDASSAEMRSLGYEVMGEYGIPTRRYFRKNGEGGQRLFHVHVYTQGNPEVARHLAFRDFLKAHPQWAEQYATLKLELASRYAHTPYDYQQGKSEFISQIDRLAAPWFEKESTETIVTNLRNI